MGTAGSKSKENNKLFLQQRVHMAYRPPGYTKGKYFLADRQTQNVLYKPTKGGSTVFDTKGYCPNFLYQTGKEEDISYVVDLSTVRPPPKALYRIQAGDTYSDFENQVVVRDKLSSQLLAPVVKIHRDVKTTPQIIPFVCNSKDDHLSFKQNPDETLLEYLNRSYDEAGVFIEINTELPTIFVRPETGSVLNERLTKTLTNRNLGYTLKDFNISPEGLFFIHKTYHFEEIYKNGGICDQGDCSRVGFNEKTGVYDKNLKITPHRGVNKMPGVYFTHFQEHKPLSLDSEFVLYPEHSFYGNIGMVFSVENIARKYHVNFKGDHYFGYGSEVTPKKFFSDIEEGEDSIYGAREAIVRTNKVSLDEMVYLTVNFSNSEMIFLRDTLATSATLSDVLDLYRSLRDDHWYIRKSALLKVDDIYKADGKKLPPIVALYPKINMNNYERLTFGTEFDVDSDHEMLA